MDAFESIVAKILNHQGFWTKLSYKINLTKEDKRKIGLPSMPRPEIDILGFDAGENCLYWVECKSYLDSRGVTLKALAGKDDVLSSRYRIFTNHEYRAFVETVLLRQAEIQGICGTKPTLKYCLATGKIATNTDREGIKSLFISKGWILYDEYWVKEGLDHFANRDYENDEAVITAKIYSRVTKKLN